MAETKDELRIIEVMAGRPSEDGGGAEFRIRTALGEGVMRVAADALADLGCLCLHAATNAPLRPGTAIQVASFHHQPLPDGSQAIGFETMDQHRLWFVLEGKGLAALQEFLSISTDAAPAPSPPRGQTH